MSAAPAADHVLRMLTLLSHHPEPVSAGMVAATLQLPRSSTYRLLSTLIDHGFVHYLPEERRYGLSVAAYELGSAYARQAPLQRIARPIVRQLVDRMKQNAHLAVLHGRDVLYVIEERAAGRPVLITDVGVRLPAVLTASGLAMLARLPAAQVRALFPNAAAFVETERGPATPTRAAPAAERCPQPGLRHRRGFGDERSVLPGPSGFGPHRPPHRSDRCHLCRCRGGQTNRSEPCQCCDQWRSTDVAAAWLPGSVQAAGRLERQRLHRPLRIRAWCRHADL